MALLQDQDEHLEHLQGGWAQSPTRRHTLPRADLRSNVALQDPNQTNAIPGEGPMNPRNAGPELGETETARGAGSQVLRMATLAAISMACTDFTVRGKAQKEKQTYINR